MIFRHQAPLVLVVVDARPGPRPIVRAENAAPAVYDSWHVQSRVACAGRGFAETEAVQFADPVHAGEGLARVGEVIETFDGGQPDVAFLAGGGVETALAPPLSGRTAPRAGSPSGKAMGCSTNVAAPSALRKNLPSNSDMA
jgi:hypothetical protein